MLEAGHTLIVADNLCNSNEETLIIVKQITNKKITFYQIDVIDEAAVNNVFSNHQIDGVIHFARFKTDESLGETSSF